MQASLKSQLDYARFIHISAIFAIGLFLFLFTKIPHKWWIWLTFMAVGAWIEPGLMVSRSFSRLRGTLSALIFSIPLLYVMQLNFRLVPITLIFTMISLNIVGQNKDKYDVAVFFITLTVLLLVIQTEHQATVTTTEGVFELVLNRGVCTLIGILVVFLVDYFLYDAFGYSEKYFLLTQTALCDMMEEKKAFIDTHEAYTRHGQIVLVQFRKHFNRHFSAIMDSAENLKGMLKGRDSMRSAEIEQRIEAFLDVSWALRKILFAMAFTKFVLKESVTENLETQYTALLRDLVSLQGT